MSENEDLFSYETQPLREKLNENETFKESSLFKILAIFSASLVALTSGFLYAWPSPFLLKISQDKQNYNISEDEASYFTVAHPVGMLILSIFIIPVVNKLGRKKTLMIAALPFIVSLLIKAFATNIWLFYLARFLAGAGDAIMFAGLPVYIGEISTPSVRGMWGNTFIILVFVGQCLVNIVGSYCSVQNASFIGLIIPISFLITFSFMPESPYFLVISGNDEQAKKSLRYFRRKENVEDELDTITTSVRKQMQENGTWCDLLKIKANRKAMIAGLFFLTSQLLSGVHVFASYTQFIFEKSGGNVSSQTSAIIYTSLTVFMYACAAYSSKLIGRRKAYMISLFLAGIVVLSEAVYFYIDIVHKDINLEPAKWFPLVGMLSFVMVSSFGIGIIPSLMIGELFAASVKAKGVSILTVAFAVNIIVTNNIFYYLNSYTGLYGPFFLFGVCNIVFTLVAYYVVPETKGKTLEEIQQTLRNM